MISKIRAIVAKLWSNSLVECYGSYATSLCIPSSDLDLVVLLSAASTLLCGYKSVETNKYRKAPIPAATALAVLITYPCVAHTLYVARAPMTTCFDETGRTCRFWSRSCASMIGCIRSSSSTRPRYARVTTPHLFSDKVV